MVEDEHPSWSYVGLQVVSGRLVQLWIACGVLWVLSEELEVLLWTEFGGCGKAEHNKKRYKNLFFLDRYVGCFVH